MIVEIKARSILMSRLSLSRTGADCSNPPSLKADLAQVSVMEAPGLVGDAGSPESKEVDGCI